MGFVLKPLTASPEKGRRVDEFSASTRPAPSCAIINEKPRSTGLSLPNHYIIITTMYPQDIFYYNLLEA
jgi:hypothetical protein